MATTTLTRNQDTVTFYFVDPTTSRIVNSLGHDFFVDASEAEDRIRGLLADGWKKA